MAVGYLGSLLAILLGKTLLKGADLLLHAEATARTKRIDDRQDRAQGPKNRGRLHRRRRTEILRRVRQTVRFFFIDVRIGSRAAGDSDRGLAFVPASRGSS